MHFGDYNYVHHAQHIYIYIYIYTHIYIYIYIYVIILTFGGRISSLVREVAVTGVEAMKWNIL